MSRRVKDSRNGSAYLLHHHEQHSLNNLAISNTYVVLDGHAILHVYHGLQFAEDTSGSPSATPVLHIGNPVAATLVPAGPVPELG